MFKAIEILQLVTLALALTFLATIVVLEIQQRLEKRKGEKDMPKITLLVCHVCGAKHHGPKLTPGWYAIGFAWGLEYDRAKSLICPACLEKQGIKVYTPPGQHSKGYLAENVK